MIRERFTPPFAREALAGITLLAASTGFACSDGSEHSIPSEPSPFSTPTELILSTPTSIENPTPTLATPKKDLPTLFLPQSIQLESVPSFASGVAIEQAHLDQNGEWIDPGLGLVQHEAFPNQTIIWGHSRWQGVIQLSGNFMLEAEVGDTVEINGINTVEKLTGTTDKKSATVEDVKYKITKFIVADETYIAELYAQDQQLKNSTIFFFTSLRVDREYNPTRYWVLPKDPIFEKAKDNILTPLEDPDKYGYVIAVLEINEGEDCKIIESYGKDTSIPGFKTPQEQCN